MSLPQQTQRLISLFNGGRFREAEIQARDLVAEHPHYAFAWKLLGAAVAIQGGNGVPMLQRAVQLMPEDHEGHNNLGNAFKELGRYEDAARCYRRALELKPDYAHAHGNLGNAFRLLERWPESVASYRRAIALEPRFAEAHGNLGYALREMGEFDEAAACLRRALELDPDFPEAHSNLLYIMNCVDPGGGLALREQALRYGASVARRARRFTTWANARDPSRPLEVGLVSGDFGNHPVGYFLEGVVAALPAERLRLHVYDTHPRTDALAQRLKARIPRWHAADASDEALARKIRDDGIDILIDLSGHTAYNRLPLFAWKPAPVQASWLGYFGTTGVPGIDYVLADRWSVPEGEEGDFTEEVWRLPETRLCFSPPPDLEIEAGALPALAAEHITFGCFSSQFKVNDAVLESWAGVLRRLPGAKLFLKAKQLADPIHRERLLGRMAKLDIGPGRLIVEGSPRREEYLRAYRRVDIMLDTFPYPGGTTTLEGLLLGVPVVGLRGERYLSRQGESILINAGLDEWIAADRDDYIEVAARMSADLDALARLRAGLRRQLERSPLLDAPRFAGHFETALRGMWQRWCAQTD